MKRYLISKGINKNRIILENKSTSTYENLTFSNKIISMRKDNAKISFSTNNYHVFRSGVIASDAGINCEGIGSKVKWYFYTNALIREFIANIVSERKKHIGIILLIIISVLVLVLIGYYNKLIII